MIIVVCCLGIYKYEIKFYFKKRENKQKFNIEIAVGSGDWDV
jgi:hypothetical protein